LSLPGVEIRFLVVQPTAYSVC